MATVGEGPLIVEPMTPEYGRAVLVHARAGFRRIGVQERLGRDATGRWRDVVLLERLSDMVGA
jgi:L-amino acid N-acyltransferase YncA